MSPIRVGCALLLMLAAGCASGQPVSGQPVSGRPAARTPLIFVLIDGFRADYLDRGITPALSALAAGGVRSIGMRPSTPSVSAPNHYTLVTGLYPDHHGMVDNTFIDRELGAYAGPEAYANPAFWEGGTPIWVTAERQGVRSASVLYAGADVPIHGVRAGRFVPRSESLRNDERVDRLLSWLDLAEAERPQLMLLYFASVDGAGHLNGPTAPATDAAIAELDTAIGRLVSGLRDRELLDRVNIVAAADHGMMSISTTDRVIQLSDLVDPDAVEETTYGATLGVNPLPGREAEVESAFLRSHDHLSCWRKSEIPARLHYGTHPRVPTIFCLADPGWTTVTPAALARYRVPLSGNHGFDPAHPEMAGLFIAHGPAFRVGLTLPAFENVHVYPLLARVLSIVPEPGDGSIDTLAPALRP